VRRSAAWLVTLPLALLGGQLAHALSHALLGSPAGEGGELFEAGAPGAAQAPTAVALVLAILLAVGCGRALGWWRGPLDGLAATLPFALVAPLVFIVQEHLELGLHGADPLGAALEPSFLPGLLLQVPFGLACYLVARWLVRLADGIRRLIGDVGRRPAPTGSERRWTPRARPVSAPLPCLHSGRGPPPVVPG